MANSSAIFEQREELMISPTGDSKPLLRKSHFLRPVLSSSNDLTVLNIHSNFTDYEVRNWSLKVYFNGWRCPQKNWKSLVNICRLKYETTWRKTGIYEAIMNSTYNIRRTSNNELILAFAEKWCPETNTFVFPWGEVTITLEDMKVLGGFDLLGEPVIYSLDTKEMVKMEGFEHESFLVSWLSRFVFPDRFNIHRNCVNHVAVCLARGIKIALGPAVLASIYRDLSLLKATIDASRKLDSQNEQDDVLSLGLLAPFQLVQVWIWERFIKLRPKPNLIQLGDPRFAKWDKVQKQKSNDLLKFASNTAADSFQWRLFIPGLKCYSDRERLMQADSVSDDEIHTFVRCIRTSELVGLDCIEQYLPHRVAMQFGIDQDLPGYVARSNESIDIAWSNYTRPVISDAKLYIPAKICKSDVTARYLEWWKPLLFARQDGIKDVFRKKRSSRCSASLKRLLKSSKETKGSEKQDLQCTFTPFADFAGGIPPPPGFPPKYKRVKTETACWHDVIVDHTQFPRVPPGFSPKLENSELGRTSSNGEKLQTSQFKGNAETLVRGSEGEMDDGKTRREGVSASTSNNNDAATAKLLDLECRIIKLEREIATLKSPKT